MVWKLQVYSHLKVFGYAAYYCQNIGKLEAMAQKCVFLGYPKVLKSYRLWASDMGVIR